MNRKRFQLGVGILVVLISTTLGLAYWQEVKSMDALEEQFRLARAERIPTNALEFAALIQTADLSHNAASYYRDFNFHRMRKGDSAVIASDLIFERSAENLQQAETYLATSSMALQILDEAVNLPRCWFNRDWAQGVAVILPEYSQMKEAAKLLALRGSVAASSGDCETAIDNVQKMFVIAKHAREEPIAIGALVSESIESIGIKHLAYWSFTDRDQPEYAAALKVAIDRMSRPNLKREYSGELFVYLSAIDLSSDPSSAHTLGFRDDAIGMQEKLVAFFKNKSAARASVIKAQRAFFAALDKPPKEREKAFDAAAFERNSALIAFPAALRLYSESGDSYDSVAMREPNWQAKRQQYIALWRALKSKKIQTTIETEDLLSPFDVKPLSYKFDGKQITIQVSRYEKSGDSKALKVPPRLNP